DSSQAHMGHVAQTGEHCACNAGVRVRFSPGPLSKPIAQSDRAASLQEAGSRFKSRWAYCRVALRIERALAKREAGSSSLSAATVQQNGVIRQHTCFGSMVWQFKSAFCYCLSRGPNRAALKGVFAGPDKANIKNPHSPVAQRIRAQVLRT